MNNHKLDTPLLPLSAGSVRVIALSGYGDIGRNMTIVETEKSMVIIDVGVMFTDGELPGVDLIISDYNTSLNGSTSWRVYFSLMDMRII
tara:strand:- start:89 stop:355 length:267 start_codon:yes stop_codon:yes gene_type:complete